MGHAAVSALSGLILEKVYEFFFSAVKNETVRYIQESVYIKRVSVKRGSTVLQLLIFA